MPEEKIKIKNLEERIDAAKDQIAEKNSPNIKPSQLGQVMKLVVEAIDKLMLKMSYRKA